MYSLLLLCHICSERRSPGSNQNKIVWLFLFFSSLSLFFISLKKKRKYIFGLSERGESNSPPIDGERQCETRVHTEVHTHHYSAVPPCRVILVTDLCLPLLCHQVCHIARLPWQPRRDVKPKWRWRRWGEGGGEKSPRAAPNEIDFTCVACDGTLFQSRLTGWYNKAVKVP